jgi:hypothetical protein
VHYRTVELKTGLLIIWVANPIRSFGWKIIPVQKGTREHREVRKGILSPKLRLCKKNYFIRFMLWRNAVKT